MQLPPVPDPFVAPLQDDETLIALIAQITGKSVEVVARRMEQEQMDIGSSVREEMRIRGITPYVWSDRLIEFYSQTDAFLYESLMWNRTAEKNRTRKWIAEFLYADFGRPARILTYGDGLGFDSLFLAQAGHEVSYFEVSKDCAQFAESIFKSAGAPIRMLATPEAIPRGDFDVAVCLDVLEHVPDPPAVVGVLASALRPGGRLIVHAPFYYVAPSVVTHLRANMTFSGDLSRLYTPHGLRLIDGRFFWNPIVLEKEGAGAHSTSKGIRHRLTLAAGGLLLSIGRYWKWPHIWVAKQLSRGDRGWPPNAARPRKA